MMFSNNLLGEENLNFSVFDDKFTKANNLYNDSKYEKSIEVYFEILDSGVHSAELYYNLGNSFYKLNFLQIYLYFGTFLNVLAKLNRRIKKFLSPHTNNYICAPLTI